MNQDNEDECPALPEAQQQAECSTRVLCLGATGSGKRATSKMMAMLVDALHHAGPDGIRVTNDR